MWPFKSKTKRQQGGGNSLDDLFNPENLLGGTSDPEDAIRPPPPATYATYRMMNAYPTNALVQSVVIDPIVRNPWKWTAREGTPSAWLDFAKEVFDPQRQNMKRMWLRAMSMGNSPFERMWHKYRGHDVATYKPLWWDITTPEIDGSGNVVALKNKPGDSPEVILDAPYFSYFAFDEQPGDPTGRSRNENIRTTAYHYGFDCAKRIAQYVKKNAGTVIQMHYPIGTMKSESGASYSTQAFAQRALRYAEQGRSLAFPVPWLNINTLTKEGDIDIDKMLKITQMSKESLFHLSSFDPGHTDYSNGFVNVEGMFDVWVVRGWLRPERAILESKHGSRADSEVQTETANADADIVDGIVADNINEHEIDDTLVMNFGEKARGAVRAICPPVSQETTKIRLSLLTAIINATRSNAGLDTNAMAEALDIQTTNGFNSKSLTPEGMAKAQAMAAPKPTSAS